MEKENLIALQWSRGITLWSQHRIASFINMPGISHQSETIFLNQIAIKIRVSLFLKRKSSILVPKKQENNKMTWLTDKHLDYFIIKQSNRDNTLLGRTTHICPNSIHLKDYLKPQKEIQTTEFKIDSNSDEEPNEYLTLS